MRHRSLLLGTAVVLLALVSFPGTAAGQGRVSNGGNVSGDIASPLQIDPWIFDANAGDGIFLRIGGVTRGIAGLFPSIRLLAPDGTLLAGDVGAAAATVLTTAPTSGTYTVLVFSGNSNGAGLGTYTLTLTKVPGPFIVPPGDEGGTMSAGVVYPGSIPLGDVDPWVFTAEAGNRITLNISGTDTGSTPFFESIWLYDPNGVHLFHGPSITLPLSVSGTYTAIVASGNLNSAGTGTYLLMGTGFTTGPPAGSQVSINDVTVVEGGAPASAVFNVTLTNPSLLAVTVNFATANGTAVAPGDYTAQTGTLTFAPGETLKTVSVPITVDAVPEPTKTFVVNLSTAVNATIADAQGQATILDDDGSRTPIVDLNGDGRGDAFLYNVTNGAYSTQVNNGAGGFASSTAFWDASWQIYPVNLNTDVFTDVFLYDPVRGLWVQARNNAGDGTFTYTSGIFDSSWQIYPADLDGNGVTDVFVYNGATGLWAKCFVNGSGDFSNFTFGQWDPAWTLTTADVNGDGRDDFHLYNRTSGVWVEAFSQAGFGTFDYPAVGQWDPGYQITAADLNGDRRTDLFLLNAAGTRVSALSRVGGDFDLVGGPQWTAGWSVHPGDLNRDGRADLFLYNPVNGIWVEAFSNGFGDFTFPGVGQFDPGWTVGVTDLNADGRADLLVSNANGVFVQLTNTSDGVFGGAAGFWGLGWKAFTRRPTDR